MLTVKTRTLPEKRASKAKGSKLEFHETNAIPPNTEKFPTERRTKSHCRAPDKKPPTITGSTKSQQQQMTESRVQNVHSQQEHIQVLRQLEGGLPHKNNHVSTCRPEANLRVELDKVESKSELLNKLLSTQQKLQDIVKAQVEERKRHQGEIQRLIAEVESRRKMHTESTERIAVLRKQQEDADEKIKELKRIVLADHSEIKELKSKLQKAGQSKSQAALRQEEFERLKKDMRQSESRHKSEMASRDVKINQLEKALNHDTKKRENAIINIKTKADAESNDAKNRIRSLEEEKRELALINNNLESQTLSQQQELINIRDMLSQVTSAYSQVVAHSVSVDKYRQAELACASLQLRIIRLERRLADREAIIEQLTDYCRQALEERTLFSQLSQEAEKEVKSILSHWSTEVTWTADYGSLALDYIDLGHSLAHERISISDVDREVTQTLNQWIEFRQNDILVSYGISEREVMLYSSIVQNLGVSCASYVAEMEDFRHAYNMVKEQLAQCLAEFTSAQNQGKVLERRVAAQELTITELKETVRKEHDHSAKLQQTCYNREKNQQRLELELARVMEDLDDATRYKEAHADLLSEVVELIQRNELAEAEAEKLSKFNAEILGHKNPQQRIFYVDRIRHELAETKQRLLKSTRDKEGLEADRVALQSEIAAYKSIYMLSDRISTTRVRVERSPLLPRNSNALPVVEITPPSSQLITETSHLSPMTLDELM